MSKIIQLYSDKDKKIKAYPKTLASQVYMDDGTTTINSQLDNIVKTIYPSSVGADDGQLLKNIFDNATNGKFLLVGKFKCRTPFTIDLSKISVEGQNNCILDFSEMPTTIPVAVTLIRTTTETKLNSLKKIKIVGNRAWSLSDDTDGVIDTSGTIGLEVRANNTQCRDIIIENFYKGFSVEKYGYCLDIQAKISRCCIGVDIPNGYSGCEFGERISFSNSTIHDNKIGVSCNWENTDLRFINCSFDYNRVNEIVVTSGFVTCTEVHFEFGNWLEGGTPLTPIDTDNDFKIDGNKSSLKLLNCDINIHGSKNFKPFKQLNNSFLTLQNIWWQHATSYTYNFADYIDGANKNTSFIKIEKIGRNLPLVLDYTNDCYTERLKNGQKIIFELPNGGDNILMQCEQDGRFAMYRKENGNFNSMIYYDVVGDKRWHTSSGILSETKFWEGAKSLTPSGSPFTVANNNPYPIYVCINGGTVTQIVYKGRSTFTCDTGMTKGMILLAPNDRLDIVYTVAPTVQTIAM